MTDANIPADVLSSDTDRSMTRKLNFPHRRYNPLRQEWVLVSPHRTQRPWQGEVAKTESPKVVHYDPDCYLCPGNARAGGHKTPAYDGVYVFENDYAALLPDSPAPAEDETSLLLRAEQERGICKVICFHPDHSLTLAKMQHADIVKVIHAWAAIYEELGAREEIRHVQIFENRGAMMGASNPHPHCQVWATEHIPNEPLDELGAQLAYMAGHGRCLLCDYAKTELDRGERIVCNNGEFIVVVPWWAVWPFETLVLPLRHVGSTAEFDAAQTEGLADILKKITSRYDRLFDVSFPYTMGFHQSPTDHAKHDEWHFHGHFYPPLLRSATVKKFMVGFELLGMAQRDITPEDAADRLRALPES